MSVFNGHTGSAVVLQWDDVQMQAAITIMLPSLDLAIFPTFYLPKGLRFTHMQLHPHTRIIFLLGTQLWYSFDQGANFYSMWNPTAAEVFNLIVGKYCQTVSTSTLRVMLFFRYQRMSATSNYTLQTYTCFEGRDLCGSYSTSKTIKNFFG